MSLGGVMQAAAVEDQTAVILWSDQRSAKKVDGDLTITVRKFLERVQTHLRIRVSDPLNGIADNVEDWGKTQMDCLTSACSDQAALVLFVFSPFLADAKNASRGIVKHINSGLWLAVESNCRIITLLYETTRDDLRQFNVHAYHSLPAFRFSRNDVDDLLQVVEHELKRSRLPLSPQLSPHYLSRFHLLKAMLSHFQRQYSFCLAASRLSTDPHTASIAAVCRMGEGFVRWALTDLCIAAYISANDGNQDPLDEKHTYIKKLLLSSFSINSLMKFLGKSGISATVGLRDLDIQHLQEKYAHEDVRHGLGIIYSQTSAEAIQDALIIFSKASFDKREFETDDILQKYFKNGKQEFLFPSVRLPVVLDLLEGLRRVLVSERKDQEDLSLQVLVSDAIETNSLGLELTSYLRLCSLKGLMSFAIGEKEWNGKLKNGCQQLSVYLHSGDVAELALLLQEVQKKAIYL
eukprot:m.43092 g.43092  ORF g.43092 m.43092 type:complete len:463 (+) comp33413_c0_seq2:57-1445(+)